ncbi:MAG TPA: DUF692 family protein [Planctomycetota bacterium]|nr:DUF692 family protein [Planctomycetota bacterium]
MNASLKSLPRLGLGISSEFGIRPTIDPLALLSRCPGLFDFLEFGSDVDRGLDAAVLQWVAQGGAATYHFLDVNFEEEEDLDTDWMARTQALATRLKAPWLCGDSGLWHFGPRDRGHGLLLPPILTRASADQTARSVRRLMDATGMMVLPENPPSLYFLGDLHMLSYFGHVAEVADCGLLLDLAHLAIFQHASGLEWSDGFDDFPFDRLVEIHVAGGGVVVSDSGYSYIDDDHRAEPLPEVWKMLDHVIPRAPNLKAIVYECEHNDPEETIPTFQRLRDTFPQEAALG